MEFQVGDRIQYIGITHKLIGKQATVIKVRSQGYVVIEFDEEIGANETGCKENYGWSTDSESLMLISHTDPLESLINKRISSEEYVRRSK